MVFLCFSPLKLMDLAADGGARTCWLSGGSAGSDRAAGSSLGPAKVWMYYSFYSLIFSFWIPDLSRTEDFCFHEKCMHKHMMVNNYSRKGFCHMEIGNQ